jgi:hypothetical protein
LNPEYVKNSIIRKFKIKIDDLINFDKLVYFDRNFWHNQYLRVLGSADISSETSHQEDISRCYDDLLISGNSGKNRPKCENNRMAERVNDNDTDNDDDSEGDDCPKKEAIEATVHIEYTDR